MDNSQGIIIDYLLNMTGMLYPVEQSFLRHFRFLALHRMLYVAVQNLKQLVLFFSKSMYDIMISSLDQLFLTSRSVQFGQPFTCCHFDLGCHV